MSEEINMKDIVTKLNTHSAELEELKRTYQETADYPTSTQIEYTDVLKITDAFLKKKKEVGFWKKPQYMALLPSRKFCF